MKRANNLVDDFTIENIIKAYKMVRNNTKKDLRKK